VLSFINTCEYFNKAYNSDFFFFVIIFLYSWYCMCWCSTYIVIEIISVQFNAIICYYYYRQVELKQFNDLTTLNTFVTLLNLFFYNYMFISHIITFFKFYFEIIYVKKLYYRFIIIVTMNFY
jgi:hypothetical protein